MYNYSQQLYKCCKSDMMENSLKSLLVEQSKALLITINSLSLVDKKNQYITIRVCIFIYNYNILYNYPLESLNIWIEINI